MHDNGTPLSKEQLKTLTDADWQQRLSQSAYYVLRQKGTERPFTGEYNHCKKSGTYHCQGCGAELFASKDKFDSGCGWPAFDQAVNSQAVSEHLDTSHGMRRIEVTCSQCNGHLGHVFPDGPTATTGMRYCINSVALELQQDTP